VDELDVRKKNFMKKTNYIKKTITPDERVLYIARVHPALHLSMVPYFLIFQGFVYVFVLTYGLGELLPLSKLLFLAPFLLFVQSWIIIATTELALTDRRVIAKTGLLSQQSVELNLPKVESVEVHQSLFGRMLNYGTITVKGTGGGAAPAPGIADPTSFRKAVQELTNQTQQ